MAHAESTPWWRSVGWKGRSLMGHSRRDVHRTPVTRLEVVACSYPRAFGAYVTVGCACSKYGAIAGYWVGFDPVSLIAPAQIASPYAQWSMVIQIPMEPHRVRPWSLHAHRSFSTGRAEPSADRVSRRRRARRMDRSKRACTRPLRSSVASLPHALWAGNVRLTAETPPALWCSSCGVRGPAPGAQAAARARRRAR